ncbi:MAG: pyridoxamine 5'-phosphate oxidase [Pseudomonadales bacterium]|nr:pyridoxamine 5'-phosphate oxidase [Pseudomonadales bacterium]
MDLESNRREYQYGHLDRETLEDSPFSQFQKWMQQAVDAEIQDPTAMSIATVSAEGRPSQRTVLLKQFDARGLVFFTNLESRKSTDIAANDAVSLHFSWLAMDRQVRIEGRAEKLKVADSLKYFLSRPKDSQIAAWASPQSRVLETRSFLESEFHNMKAKFLDHEIPLPTFWGGFKVVPDLWEFWQGGEHRLHDRFQYSLNDEQNWKIDRLAP